MSRYYLPQNKSNATPGLVCFVDTETLPHDDPEHPDAKLHKLRLGCATLGRFEKGGLTRRKELDFTTCAEFWEWLDANSDSRRPTWIFAHNIGFDLTVLCFWERLESGDYKFYDRKQNHAEQLGDTEDASGPNKKVTGFICADDPPTIIGVTNRRRAKYIFIDTINYWVTSLAKLGDKAGVKKLVMPSFDASDTEWFTYCRRDTLVLETVVVQLIKWVKDNDLGKFRFTAPSQAMAAFRHAFYREKIILNDCAEVKLLERAAYYGGKLDCYFIGEINEPVYELDVTSLYPSVMSDCKYPCELLEWSIPCDSNSPRNINLDETCIANVQVVTDVETYPLRSDIGTVYPTGTYCTTLAGPELVRALEADNIERVYGWSRYRLADLFSEYVDYFWHRRLEHEQQGDNLGADLCKLLLNGLYGKFGQTNPEWEDRPDMIAESPWGKHRVISPADGIAQEFRFIGNYVQERVLPTEHKYAFPAIAAFVTSNAREYMLSLERVAGKKNVLYIVTDALFVTQGGYDNLMRADLIRDRELGYLRLKERGDSGSFRCLHHYRVGDKQVNGSVKRDAVKNADGSYTETQFESLSKILTQKPKGGVLVYPRQKTFSYDYNRGQLLTTGAISPLNVTVPEKLELGCKPVKLST